jgi:hypothetical protein
MSLEHLHKDPVGCQLMKHAAQELMSYTSGSTWQVYIGLTLPWIACTDSHSTILKKLPLPLHAVTFNGNNSFIYSVTLKLHIHIKIHMDAPSQKKHLYNLFWTASVV